MAKEINMSRLKELRETYVPALGCKLGDAPLSEVDSIVDKLKMDKKLHNLVKEYLDHPDIKKQFSDDGGNDMWDFEEDDPFYNED